MEQFQWAGFVSWQKFWWNVMRGDLDIKKITLCGVNILQTRSELLYFNSLFQRKIEQVVYEVIYKLH